jgi:hypothetical protein
MVGHIKTLKWSKKKFAESNKKHLMLKHNVNNLN